jgi:CubicO group peptidase (beta-lactamase class C family)
VRVLAALAAGALLAGACSSGGGSSTAESPQTPEIGARPAVDLTFPGAEWARTDPLTAGFDAAALESLATEAEAHESNCLVVTRGGELVAEWYWNGTGPETEQQVFSVTKSLTSTLVGIVQDAGAVSIDDPASVYIPEWVGTASETVTIEDLVSNDSGRFWSLSADYRDLVAAPDRTAFAVGLTQESAPGTVWTYNNAAIQTLGAVLTAATGEQPAVVAEAQLFEPIGMGDTEMTSDPSGHTSMFFGARTTCRDLARFGYLFLRGGAWDGEQVVSSDWVDAATGRPSQELNSAYGYLWWLNRRGPIADPLQALTGRPGGDIALGQLAPGAPDDMYWALGLGGQVVQVDPGSDTVVVRLGSGNRDSGYGAAQTARVVTDALVER